ncbi:hypothetical protein SK571_36815 [Lentzea sp. BCCO 10_0798]|uniref:Uncharacterized protein n=1 Tax=Lentzea kristufekii TaxID=3095430 RepID=A0ABU4U311_9PSEU|nr:hypothetical protein [Lentzea sp. BCCO 10_0798]MDX8054965.1 hypothetical protein [Lentzea sp. BCCO 10_0798]
MINSDSNSRQRERTRAIRARMRLTGEPYVVAARHHDAEMRRKAADRMPVVRCPQCSEGTVEVDVTPACPVCGATWDSGAQLAVEYAAEFLGLDWHSSIKDGGAPPTQDCPDCGEQAVVTVRSKDTTFWTRMCLSCATPWNESCIRCGAPIQHREDGDSLACHECWQDAIARD